MRNLDPSLDAGDELIIEALPATSDLSELRDDDE
jgi:hypothetical protein